jgi:predicted RNA binding protein YcfA (HicA-like mRNA interferase family)
MGLRRLPLASGRAHIKAFKRLGFGKPPGRPGKGDHVILVHEDGRMISVPNHREVKRQTLSTILEQAKIEENEYLDAFR